MENLLDLKAFLSVPKDIVVISHRNPDGDAVGSSLGLKQYLVRHGHTVHVIVPSEFPEFLSWMPDSNDIIVYDTQEEESADVLKKADIIFYLDFNGLDRIDKVGDLAAQNPCPKVMIDHHLYPEPIADYMLSDTSASSTCELVYDFIDMMDDRKLIDPIIGESLYTGILTDTGSFKYATSSKLFRIVAHLYDIGVDNDKIQDHIFNTFVDRCCIDDRQKEPQQQEPVS